MHNDSTMRCMTRVMKPARPAFRRAAHALVALITFTSLAACADETPVQPKARIPEGGVKSVALGVNILPAGQQFPDKIAFATGSPNGKAAYVQVYSRWGTQMLRFKAFTDTWDTGGVEVAVGDVTGDGWPDIIAGEGPTPFTPIGSRFGVWDGKTGAWIDGYSMGSYKGGYRVGAGDINGDGRAEVFTCTGPNSAGSYFDILEYHPWVPNIGGLKPPTGLGFYTGKNTYNGCRVAGGDVDGDGKDDLIAVFEGPSNALLIATSSSGTKIRWNAFGAGYTGQISVAAADVNGDKKAEIFLGRLTALDKMPPVRIYDGAGVINSSALPLPFITYPITNSIYNTGIYVGARDLTGDGIPELLAKLSTTGGYSAFVAKEGPTFTIPWLNRAEPPETLPAGGPIS